MLIYVICKSKLRPVGSLTLLGLGVKGINRKFPLSFSLSVHFQLTFTFTSTFQVQLGLRDYRMLRKKFFSP